MKDTLISIVVFIIVACVIVAITYGGWKFKRSINYKWSYASFVQEQIEKNMQDHINKYHKDK